MKTDELLSYAIRHFGKNSISEDNFINTILLL